MIKFSRSLIILTIVMILIIIGIIVVVNNNATQEDDIESTANNIFTIYSHNTSDIAEVKVYNGTDTIKAVNLGNSIWTIGDMSTDDIDSSKAYGLAGTVSTLTSKNKVEESPTDLAQYGLDNPSLTVTITKNSGETDTIYIGDMSSTLGEYFVMTDRENTVYTIYAFKVDILKQPLSYYQEFNRFNINIDDISNIKIIRKDETIELKTIDSTNTNRAKAWEMVSPYTSSANDEYINNRILSPVDKITLSNPINGENGRFNSSSSILIISVKPYDNSTGKYGEVYTETLTIGKTDGEKTYVKYKDNVFAASTQNVSFVNDSSYSIVSKQQALVDISEIESVTFEYGGLQYAIGITYNNGEMEVKFNGKNVDSEITQLVYKNILGLSVDGVYTDEELKDSLLKITYKGIQSSSDAEVDFREIDDLNCALVRNEKTEFTIMKSKVKDFIELFDSYIKNHEKQENE